MNLRIRRSNRPVTHFSDAAVVRSQQFADCGFSMERGIAYSLAQLMLRPGHLMRDYIGGRRGRQAKPLLLLMVTAALVVFLSRYLLEGDVLGKALQADTIGASQRSEEHTSELQSLMRHSSAVYCLKKKQ